MRVFAPSPEYLQKYEQYVNLWKQLYPMLEEKCKTGAISNFELIRARVRRDVAQLKLMQLKGGRRPSVPFSEAYLTVKGEASALAEADLMYKAGMLPLDEVFKLQLQLAEAEFQLQEAERFLDPQRVAEAKEAVKTYPALLTDAQMEKIMSAGLNVTHVDSHQHMHMLPPVWNTRVRLRSPQQLDIPKQTVPTGVPSAPPSGPA